MRTLPVLLLAASLALTWPVPGRGLSPELKTLSVYVPGNAEFLILMDNSMETTEAILSLVPLNPDLFKKIFLEEQQAFTKKTGYDYFRQPNRVALSGILPYGGRPPEFQFYTVSGQDMTPVVKCVKDSRSLGAPPEEIAFEGVPGMRIGPWAWAFAEKTLWIMAPTDQMPAIIKGRSPGNDRNVAAHLFHPRLEKDPFALSVKPPRDALEKLAKSPVAERVGVALVGRIERVGITVDMKSATALVLFNEAGAAKAAVSIVQGLVQTAKGQIGTWLESVRSQNQSPLDSLGFKNLAYRTGGQTGRELLDSVTVTADGAVLMVTAPLEKLMVLRGPGSGLAVLGAGALLVQQVLAQQQVSDGTMCYQQQEEMDAALEQFRADSGRKDAILENSIDELLARKYLEKKPTDPGQGEASFTSYFTGEGGRVNCKMHGARTVPDKPAGR